MQLRPGTSVRLRVPLGGLAAGAVGRVVGRYTDEEAILVDFSGAKARVRAEDLEEIDRPSESAGGTPGGAIAARLLDWARLLGRRRRRSEG